MGSLGPKQYLDGMISGVQMLPYPYGYRCPFGLGGAEGERVGLHYIENQLGDPESGVLPAAGMILETVQGEGGVIAPSADWLRGIRRITREAGVPLILDEMCIRDSICPSPSTARFIGRISTSRARAISGNR